MTKINTINYTKYIFVEYRLYFWIIVASHEGKAIGPIAPDRTTLTSLIAALVVAKKYL